MIVAVDIGNTTIAIAVLEKQRFKQTWSVKTALSEMELKKALNKVCRGIKRYSQFPEAIIICSVVPKTLDIVKPSFQRFFGKRPLVVGRDFKVPIKNLYRKPYQVGQDRLVCAYGAMQTYGKPAIVIDFGTAITFDVVSQKGEYLGGVIVPGLRLYAESLFEKTALLPKVRIKQPKAVIGKDTENSILSGIFYGYGLLCNGMVKLLSSKIKNKPVVIVTGGNSSTIKKLLKNVDRTDRFLVFRGIALAYRNASLKTRN